MSSVPLVAWLLALPSGTITRPPTAIGLFQWPNRRRQRDQPVEGRRVVDLERAVDMVVDVEQAAGDHRAGAGGGVGRDAAQPRPRRAAGEGVDGGPAAVGDEHQRAAPVDPDGGLR